MNKEIILPAGEHYIPGVELRAGSISTLYEGGRLRYVSAGGTEIVRMVYAAVRDENWLTLAPVLRNEKILIGKRSFSISYSADYTAGNIRYRAAFEIQGREDSCIVFIMQGTAASTFRKRRIGLCLLHPVETCTGKNLEVMQPDGKSYSSSFPEFISPFQPFLQVQGMKWITENKVWAEASFEGDVFETEDQRNWSDNSYKTYSTPLSVPAPATVITGEVMQQKITIRANAKHSFKWQPRPEQEACLPLPKIGYAKGEDQKPLSTIEIDLFQKIPFDHYRVQADLAGNWKETMRLAVQEARAIHTSLELVLNVQYADKRALIDVVDACKAVRDMISSVLVLSSGGAPPIDVFEESYEEIKALLPAVPIGYGTGHDFVDLNRNRPIEIKYDFVNFHLQPQVHTTDSRSIMDNLCSHQTLIRSAKKFTRGVPVHVSTINLAPPGVNDERFHTPFAAWWTLLALRNLSMASSLTFYELTGEMGLVNGGRPGPIYEALRSLHEFAAINIVLHTGNKVVFENGIGERLSFSSELPDPRSSY